MFDLTKKLSSSQWWQLLLIVPFIGVLWVPFFNKVDPELIGIPFFFWYQFLWVFVSAAITAFVYRKSSLPPVKVRVEKQ